MMKKIKCPIFRNKKKRLRKPIQWNNSTKIPEFEKCTDIQTGSSRKPNFP